MSNVRIIGGKYKGKNLYVLELEGLRPTTDRVRETIFNLLTNHIENTKVLDLFAGSGVLGLEAISRGATSLTLVELNKDNATNLKEEASSFNEDIKVVCQNALDYLKNCTERFDLVFLDPPYASNLLQPSIELLLERNLIHDNTILYIETSSASKQVFKGLMCIREQSVGQIKFGLYKKSEFLF